MTLDFQILGHLQVLRHNAPILLGGPRQRSVLAALLVRANRTVSSEQLIDEIWSGRPPAGAKATLHAYVSKLRRALEPERPAGGPHDVLVSEAPGYRLRVDADQVDAFRFEALAEAGRDALTVGEPERAAALLTTALSLWRGPALADLASEAFAVPHAARLDGLRLAVIEDHLEATLALGRHRSVLGELDDLVRDHPLRERLRGQLMVALYRAGHRTEALRVSEEARSVLGDRLGIEPGPTLRALEQAILDRDPGLDWRPSRPSIPVLGAAAGEAGSAPFLDRDEELALLQRRLGEALGGRGRLVLVTGDTGIGKTRLVEEIAVTARSAEAEVVWGHGSGGERAPAFSPWIEIVQALASRFDAEQMRAALGGAAEVARIVPELTGLAPGPATPSTRRPTTTRFHLNDAMVRFLGHLAARRPLVIVLDDVHRADVASLELLGFLGPQLPAVPILLVATYRDVEVGPTHPLVGTLAKLGYEPAVSRLALGGLGIAAAARLVAAFTGAEPSPAMVAALYQRTEGNPLFLGELIRLLQAEDRLSPEGALAAPLPDEVRAVIARRLTGLPRATLRLLEMAAVAGRDFDLEVLGEAEGLGPDRALERLEPAFVMRILAEDPTLPGRYRFGHALIQETLSSGLSRLRRTHLHHRVGQALERIHGTGDGAHLVPLAHHFFHAASSETLDVAVTYTVRAAQWCTSHLAYEQAQEQLHRSLLLLDREAPSLDRAQRELEVQLRLGLLGQTTEGYAAPATGEAYARALDLCHQLQQTPGRRPPPQLLATLLQLSSFFCVRGDFPAGRELAEQMFAIGRQSGDRTFSWGGHLARGVVACQAGQLTDARDDLERATELSTVLDERTAIPGLVHHPGVISSATLAVPLWLLGDDRARELTNEAVNLARELDDDTTLALALFFAALLAVLDGDIPLARRWTDEGVGFCSERGFRVPGAALQVFRGWARTEQRDAGGVAEAAEGIAAFDATGARMHRTLLLGLVAQVERRAGRVADALKALEEALATVAATGEHIYEAELHRLRAEVLLATPESADGATAAFERAVAVAEAQGATALAERARAGLRRTI